MIILDSLSLFLGQNPWFQYPILQYVPCFSLTPLSLQMQCQKNKYRCFLFDQHLFHLGEKESILHHLRSMNHPSLLEEGFEYQSDRIYLSINPAKEYILILY